MLPLNRGYHHAIYRDLSSRGITDVQTVETVANTPALPPDWDAATSSVKPHAQRLADRFDALHKQYIDEGWQYLREGAYLRSKGAFDNAHLCATNDRTPYVGKLLCAVADEEYNSAIYYLLTLTNGYDDMFEARHRLEAAYGNAEVAESLQARLMSMVSESPDWDGAAALHVYMLWLDGQSQAAHEAADRLRDRFRTSVYAGFADRIRDRLRDDAIAEALTAPTG